MAEQLPIAEVFDSIQGEGFWTGTPMRFIRLAGCPVGKAATQEYCSYSPEIWPDTSKLPIYPSKCRTWDGRVFDCDTDFRVHTFMGVDELLADLWQQHICLTGGEPLIHQERLIALGFFRDAFAKGKMIHVETSGTVLLNPVFEHDSRIWITVAPKWGWNPLMIAEADEIKFLVDEQFSVDAAKGVLKNIRHHLPHIFLSPVNEEKTVNQDNVKRAEALLKEFSGSRLSCQWHKFLNMR